MSFLSNILPRLVNNVRIFSQEIVPVLRFHSLANRTEEIPSGGQWLVPYRTKIRNYFPRPSERKRIKRHGYEKRMSTPAGQRILMRRILKGRHVLTH